MNEIQIRHTFELMKSENELIEVRTISSRSNYSGYFKSVDKLIEQLKNYDNANIYFILNKISDACYSREQRDKFIEKVKNTTSDNDIINREWLLIDIDPKRPSGVSSSDKEKEDTKQYLKKIYEFLRNIGFTEPLICDSGNGFHFLYKISLENNQHSTELIKNFLVTLDMLFVNSVCNIDKAVFNASRITKLYGTISKKGNNTTDRPHRISKIIRFPEEIKVTPEILIQRVVDIMPVPEKPTYTNNYNTEKFDLQSFISKHRINVTNQHSYSGGTKYILDHCLFDDSHKGKDAALFELSSGAIGYKCLHDSCSSYKWQDVRKKFEPDAYDKKFEPIRITKKSEAIPQPEIKDKGKKFYSLSEIVGIDRTNIVSIPSGFNELDKKIIGFNKGETTIWSGKNGSAKSTVLNQISLNSIENGFKGAIFSGEMQPNKLKNWIHLQAAGRQFAIQSSRYDNLYYVSKDTSSKIDTWMGKKLFIYNNQYGNNYLQLIKDFTELVKRESLDWIMIDNLMTLELEEDNFNQNKQQKRFILDISTLSKELNIHIHTVAHPRKNVGFLRKEDISGTADLTNAVDNVIICHRNNSDYLKAIKDYFPKEMLSYLTLCSNYIEVCKNRDMGIMDLMVGLHYEKESKRLLNEFYENKVYSWQEIEKQIVMKPLNPDVGMPKNEDFNYEKEIEEAKETILPF
jgi:hypothetical protein